MSIDRTATLKNAEKLLRQGKLKDAIAEYVRVVEDQPRDWNTANALGDLYVRNKEIDKAVEQFTSIADSLTEQGFLPKAGAVYKKILKLKPDSEHALLRAAEISGSLGLFADARTHLKIVADRRRAKNDQRGVAEVTLRLAGLDPEDVPARIAGARARLELRDPEGALRDLKELAAMLSEKGRQAEVVAVLAEAAALSPADAETRERLLAAHLEAGDYAKARDFATSADQFKAMAARLEAAGDQDGALAMLREAAALDVNDAALRAELARAYIARNDLESAAEFVTVETAGDDLPVLLRIAEGHFRADRHEEGMAFIRHVLAAGGEHWQDVAMVGWSLAEQNVEAGYRLVELSAEAAVADSDWPSAAAALQEFVTRVPRHLPALMRLIEICVDGGLEATLYTAQAQLADAYIAAGSAAEARFIAEDLVAREPWDRVNIERFRRALVLSGESDPDTIIADRLSGESPFTSTDLTFTEEMAVVAPEIAHGLSSPDVAVPGLPDLPASTTLDAEPADVDLMASLDQPESPVEIPTAAPDVDVNLEQVLGEMDGTRRVSGRSDSVEVDLSIVLSDMEHNSPEAIPSETPVEDLEQVFARLRTEIKGRSQVEEAAEAQYANGLALSEAGRLEDALSALEAAAASPRFRFLAGSQAGRVYLKLKLPHRAIEWFEKATQAPPPTAEEGRLLLYDLAEALESVGEVSRSLSIYLELQTIAGNYRDVPARVDRLAKAQARG